MFLESQIAHKQKGSIEIICGSMFSGKTEELLRRLRRAEFAKLKIIVFKPKVDKRYHKDNIVSHNNNLIEAIVVNDAKEMLSLADSAQVVGIDEAQFFNKGLINVCNTLADNGKRIIIAGLDMDFLGAPFGVMPHLLSIAEHVTKVHAICIDCGDIASYSFRKVKGNELIKLGEKKEYKALCRGCFKKNNL